MLKFLSENIKILIGFILVTIIIFFLFLILNNQKQRSENLIDLTTINWLSNQFPLLLNDQTGSYTLECLHTETTFKNYKILDTVTVKASIACMYTDINLKNKKVYIPVALEIIEGSIRHIQFLSGFSSSGIYENSQLTESAIINVVSDTMEFKDTGSRILATISHPDSVKFYSNGFKYTNKLFESNVLDIEDIFNFSLNGDPKIIQIKNIDGNSVIFSEKIVKKEN